MTEKVCVHCLPIVGYDLAKKCYEIQQLNKGFNND